MANSLRPGGALLIFDKVAARPGYLGSVVYRLTLAAKYEAGALPDEIIQKELSLAGVQRPMGEEELVGFTPIFRFGDFAGWLFERGA
jgi:tRNA (cmo5U34)-methyltransferase